MSPVLRFPAMLLFLLGCSDYKLAGEGDDPVGAIADVEVSVVDGPVCAAPAVVDVTVASAGDAPLTISDLAVDGAGWTLDPVTLPLTLAAGESTALHITGTSGPGSLYVVTDDPDEGTVTVPLTFEVNAAPTVSIDAPTAGTVFPDDADVTLVGTVGDDLDAPDALALAWSSTQAGTLSTAPADASGATSVTWSARDAGPHTLSLTATDSCGASTTATLDVCQQGAYTYDALDLTAWHYEGHSRYDEANAWLELTDTGVDEVGSAFETSTEVDGTSVSIDFSFYIGGGTGADGLSLTALDVSRMTTFLGGSGCGIGYGGDAACTLGPALPGWSIEVDTYYNADADATDQDHVAFTLDGDVDAPRAWAALPEMEDTGWHHMVVNVSAPRVTVTIDDVVYIDGDYAAVASFPAYVGFTAGTGSLTNYHLIDSLLVTDYACE